MSLQVQVHIKLPKTRPGVEYSKTLLDEIAERWLKGEKLPASIKVSALEWRTAPKGKWKEERDPRRIKNVREDFRFIAQAGFDFTGVSSLGGT
jgi:hypothetical protein